MNLHNIKSASELNSDMLKALWYDLNGDWHKAHEICQIDEGNPDYDRIHAYLHRKEGDRFNARWWYDRLGLPYPKVSLEKEWEELVEKYGG